MTDQERGYLMLTSKLGQPFVTEYMAATEDEAIQRAERRLLAAPDAYFFIVPAIRIRKGDTDGA